MRQWFLDGAPKIGSVLTLDNPHISEIAGLAGLDWVWLDGEHGAFEPGNAALAAACLPPATKSFVRVPDRSPTTIKRFLDAGCDGIIVPHVNTRAEFDAITRAALFPPRGERSVGISRAQGFGAYFSEGITTRNYALVVQVETREAVGNIEALTAADDLDGILMGPYDLSGSLGVLGDVTAPAVTDAIAKVLSICKRDRVPCGIFAADAQRARACIEQGFDFVGVGVDSALLLDAYRRLLATARGS